MSFTIEEASPSYAATIAQIFLSNATDEFMKLQFGTVDPGIMTSGLTGRLQESIETSGQAYIVARDDETKEIMSYAQWTKPRAEDQTFVRQSGEEKAAATEAYRAKLLPGMNVPLVMDFRREIIDMRERALGDCRHWMLGNLVTLPSCKRRGAGSALSRWPFDRADKEGVIVYLDTNEEGNARGLYERLGFRKVDEAVFDLSKYGGRGVHTHIGMIREPQKAD